MNAKTVDLFHSCRAVSSCGEPEAAARPLATTAVVSLVNPSPKLPRVCLSCY